MCEARCKFVWHFLYGYSLTAFNEQLPVDWLQPSSDKRVALAVIRLRATETDDYRGPVFVNPGMLKPSLTVLNIFSKTLQGGPGGSGIHFMKSNGKSLQTVVGRNYV